MALPVRIAAKATREIDEAVAWLARRSRPAAARWLGRLMEAIRSLGTNPERHGLAPESEWYPGELRHLLYGKRTGVYRILFEVREEVVYVLRVRHAAQDLLEPGEL